MSGAEVNNMAGPPPAPIAGWGPHPPPQLVTRNLKLESVERALKGVVISLEKEQERKKAISEAVDPIHDVARRATSILNDLHSVYNIDHKAVAKKAINTVEQTKELWASINALIPTGEFYRYAYLVSPALRTLTQLVAYGWFIIYDQLVSALIVSQVLSIPEDTGEGVVLIADDYLQGVIGAINELPRLSVNAVTAGNYQLPLRVSHFVNDVFSAYSQLNLRNDQLRRKFDSLKYDVKKCEDVIYDLTLRGLIPRTPRFAGVVPLPGGPHSPAQSGQPLPPPHSQSPANKQSVARASSPGQALGFQPYPGALPQGTLPRYWATSGSGHSSSPNRRLAPLPGPSPRRLSGSMLPSGLQNTSPLRTSGVELPPIRSQLREEAAEHGGEGSTEASPAAPESSKGPTDPDAMEEDKEEEEVEHVPSQATPLAGNKRKDSELSVD